MITHFSKKHQKPRLQSPNVTKYLFYEELFRYAIYEKTKRTIEDAEGMERFTRGYKEYGVCVLPDGVVMCREWVPNAKAVYLSGDFSK